jgi:uncharacterized protein YlxW (UPF0749 family)
MQQSENGGVILLSEGEQLDPKSLGPNEQAPMSDWRSKAFELAREVETLETKLKSEQDEKHAIKADRNRWKAATVILGTAYLISAVANLIFYAMRG